MNVEDTLKAMIEAAAAAAKGKWKKLRAFAEAEFRTLATAGRQLEADLLADLAAAAVLIASFTALVVGATIFLPYVVALS